MKKLQERYGRFHARFPLDDVYLALPRPLRNDAYLYLLALSGNRRAEEADGNMPRSVAEAIARGMGLNPEKMLLALAAIMRDGKPRVLSLTAELVCLLKQDKWQDTPDEIAELKQKRSDAGRLGGLNSGRTRQPSKPEAPTQANPKQVLQQVLKQPVKQVLKQNEAEIEREIETESLSPPNPPPSPEALDLQVALSGLIGQSFPKGTDALTAMRMWSEFGDRYDGVADMVETVRLDLERRHKEDRQPLHSLEGCRLAIRWEYDTRADAGRLRAREQSSRTDGEPTRIDVSALARRTLRVVQPTRDPATESPQERP